MSEQTPQCPTTDDRDAWKAYWKTQGMPWRTEPEIDEERQAFLAERRAIQPDIEKDIYPFGNIELRRSDIEWLLATHRNGRGPISWVDEQCKEEEDREWGLDLRGAKMRKVNLQNLPLARLLGGLAEDEWGAASNLFESVDSAALDLTEAKLDGVHLEGALLTAARLERAKLTMAHLEQANLKGAHLNSAQLFRAHLEGAALEAASLAFALANDVHLEHASLQTSSLAGAELVEAHLEGADLTEADLSGADLYFADMDRSTVLIRATLSSQEHGAAELDGVRWGGANLTVVDWTQVPLLGDERKARDWTPAELSSLIVAEWRKLPRAEARSKVRAQRRSAFEVAVRASRQLATELRNQGLNEHADRFAYRAQVLQRRVLRIQRRYLQAFGSWLLDMIAGYGYRPARAFLS